MRAMWMSSRSERLMRLEEQSHLVQSGSSAKYWDRSLLDADYFVVDLETSGFDPRADKVLSLAAATLAQERLQEGIAMVDQYDLVAQEGLDAVPESIWALTGLTAQRLQADGVPWRDVLFRALSLSANRVWIAHHARHELSFIERHARLMWKMRIHPLVIDTALLTQVLFRLPAVPTLEAACRLVGVELLERHRADLDVLMTVNLWRALIPRCGEQGLETIGEVIHWVSTHAGGLS